MYFFIVETEQLYWYFAQLEEYDDFWSGGRKHNRKCGEL